MVMVGDTVSLPPDALGKCFVPRTQPYVYFDVGFDRTASLDTLHPQVVGLLPGGPAARAGLLDYDIIAKAKVEWGNPQVEVELTILRNGNERVIRYMPVGGKAVGPGWKRDPRVPDDQCVAE